MSGMYLEQPGMNRSTQYGFTMIELLQVVGIVGILAAVAIPVYQDYTTRSKVAEGLELAMAVEKSISGFRDRWGILPRDNAAAGLPDPAAMRGTWVSSIEIKDGVIAIRFVPSLARDLNERSALVLRPASNPAWPTGALVWVCQDHDPPEGATLPAPDPSWSALPNKYVPVSCRKL